MLFMVIEHFTPGRERDVYRRFQERGRMAPDGVAYVASWIAADFSRCFQVMKADDVTLLQDWVVQWSDLARFEIVPVAASADVAAMIRKHL
jgi:hypothetical protein